MPGCGGNGMAKIFVILLNNFIRHRIIDVYLFIIHSFYFITHFVDEPFF